MNPSSSFTFLPNPNPNPNPNTFHHHPPPFTASTPTTVAPPPPDLSTTLSNLNHLIHLSRTAIQSLTTLLPTIPTTAPHLSTCPFNPTHRVPPPSLFRHFLQCPSSPLPVDSTSILKSLHYPTSLQSNHPEPFLQTLLDTDPNHDLCFSLDEYPTSLPPNFFYLSCPGVVSFPDDHDPTTTNRMLTLPVVLSAECANFTVSEISCLSIESATKLFPSEAWGVRNEIRVWNDYPAYYSSSVARSILCLYKCSFSCGLQEWLIVNSPRYGIVIDLPMSDHILLLLRLCLKTVIREAIASLGYRSGVKVLHCPVLVRVLVWLGSQLSLLYGEFNGKLFAIDMFKQSLLFAQSSCLMFSEEEKDTGYLGLRAEDEKCEETLKEKSAKQEKTWVIFVSQVAAAVAALHERAMLERKIKAMRDLRPLTNYQRVAEHDLESRKADEQRQKRSNYRPILEHDGLLWQRAHNEGTNRTKSKAELLAEERDYKRRRTSYRGKKIKRNATHVMRDIIEDYMEEIKQAGGIGCLVKGAEVSGVRACQYFDVHGMSTDDEARIRSPNSFELNKGRRQGYNKQLDSDNSIRSTRFEDESTEGNMLQREDSHRQKGHLEAHSTDRKRHDRAYYRSADGQTSNSGSREKLIDRGKRGNNEARKYFPLSPDGSRRQSHEKISHHYDRIHQSVERKDSRPRKADRNGRSTSAVHHEFEDRYDPSES